MSAEQAALPEAASNTSVLATGDEEVMIVSSRNSERPSPRFVPCDGNYITHQKRHQSGVVQSANARKRGPRYTRFCR